MILMGFKDFDILLEKIIRKEPVTSSGLAEMSLEDRKLLALAKLLRETDFSKEKRLNFKTLSRETKCAQGLTDDDLDLVAGGCNPNALSDDNNGKKTRN